MEQDPIFTFDTLYSCKNTQMYKAIFPYINPEMKPLLAIYIKSAELQYTFHYSSKMKYEKNDNCKDDKTNLENLNVILENIEPYLSESENIQNKNMRNMIRMFSQFEQIKPLLNMITNLDSSSSDQNQEILKSLLNEDQMAMFEMFMNSNNGGENHDQK